jgi:glycosyltransferase involved in cell wall biosynthesis
MLTNVRIVHWAHDLHTSGKHTRIYKKSDFILATNSSTLRALLNLVNRPLSEGCITLNPVTNQQASEALTQDEARKQVHLEKLQAPLIVYTGKIGRHYDREIQHIFSAAKLLPDYQFLLTGGKHETVSYWEEYCQGEGITNIQFTGYIPDYRRVRYYQYSADVLLSYYTDQAHDTRYNLPNKICEYMVAGRIIVTPDYPATRDLLRNDNCHFVEPDNPTALAEGIRHVVEHRTESEHKAVLASKEARALTFGKIAENILNALPK